MIASRLWITVLVLAAGVRAQAWERGSASFAQGDFTAAAAEFAGALERAPDDARLAYNLALAQWRAGETDAAETSAEKAAALSGGSLAPLRDGIVGNLRHAAAMAALAEDLEGALELAKQAKSHFTRGAVAADGSPALARNLERAIRLIEEIERRIEEQKQEQEQQEEQQDEQGEPSDDQQQRDEQKDPSDEQRDPQDRPEDDPQRDESQQDESQQDESQRAQDEPEPQPQEQPEPQPGEDEQQPEEQQQEQPQPQPPEDAVPLQLSEEEKKRLLQKLEELEQQRAARRAAAQRRRPKVEKDW